jgi:hypothetical protein
MTRLRVLGVGVLVGLAVSVFVLATPSVGSEDDPFAFFSKRIVMRDDCDPRDPAWAVGPCRQLRGEGDMSRAEFLQEVRSSLSRSTIGHQSLWNDPPYVKVLEDRTLFVTNRGGLPHTFTEVAEFGGGSVPGLNVGLDPAPACVSTTSPPEIVAPGARIAISGLEVGNHRFMCCLHPWMRTLIKVKPNPARTD